MGKEKEKIFILVHKPKHASRRESSLLTWTPCCSNSPHLTSVGKNRTQKQPMIQTFKKYWSARQSMKWWYIKPPVSILQMYASHFIPRMRHSRGPKQLLQRKQTTSNFRCIQVPTELLTADQQTTNSSPGQPVFRQLQSLTLLKTMAINK